VSASGVATLRLQPEAVSRRRQPSKQRPSPTRMRQYAYLEFGMSSAATAAVQVNPYWKRDRVRNWPHLVGDRALLASVVFSGETASGWQIATLAPRWRSRLMRPTWSLSIRQVTTSTRYTIVLGSRQCLALLDCGEQWRVWSARRFPNEFMEWQ